MTQTAQDLRPWRPLTATDAVHQHHGGAGGYVVLARRGRDGWMQRGYLAHRLPDVLADWVNGPDTYITQNSFRVPKRTVDQVEELRGLWADIDCYKQGLHPMQALLAMEREYGRTLPEPTHEVSSGRGIYLIWLIHPEGPQALPEWQTVMAHISKVLGVYGADACATDAARVLRLAETSNSKSGLPVQVWRRPGVHPYRLADVVRQYLPEITEVARSEKPKRPGRPRKIVSLHTILTLHYHRRQDLVRLCELRDWRMVGHRERVLWLHRYWGRLYLPDPADALEESLHLNSRFRHPLPEREVSTATRSAESHDYKISNAKLIAWLKITADEQRHLSTIIGKGEKRRRDSARKLALRRDVTGRTRRQMTVQQRLQELSVLLAARPSATQSALASAMGICQQRVSQLLQLSRIHHGLTPLNPNFTSETSSCIRGGLGRGEKGRERERNGRIGSKSPQEINRRISRFLNRNSHIA